MNKLRSVFLLLLVTVIGCGQSLVEFPISERPFVTLTTPLEGATGVSTKTTVRALFSKDMDPATLSAKTFTLTQGATAIPATVSYAGQTATLVPTSPLANGVSFTARISASATDTEGTALGTSHVWGFSTREAIDVTAPTVTFTYPADGAVAVSIDKTISAAFSEPMDPETLGATTFTVRYGAMSIPGVVSSAGAQVTFAPAASLAFSAVVTATLTTGAKDLAGNALASDHEWSFTTEATADVTAPTITFTDPIDGATGVDPGTKVRAAFNEPLDCATLDAASFTLTEGASPIAGVVTCAGPTATFTPGGPLTADAILTATIAAGVKDLSGNELAADHTWSFRINALPVGAAPFIVFTDPANFATGVDAGVHVHAAFNQPMDCATLGAATFTLTHEGAPVPGVVTCAGPTATFTPASPLTGAPTYIATITTSAKNLSGDGLLQDYVWSFETGPHPGLATVNLGVASLYAILAFNTVTNVNNPGTVVTGNLGISPGAALVGFPPGQVVGVIHAGDPPAAAAKAALLAAYNDAAGRLNPAVLPADLSGLTFAPGLYNNSTSVMISSGNLTLDAKGDSNAVFIFQMGSTLTTNAATQVILSGGAKATNIFWAVGTSATLGTNSIFKGTILAASAITMQTGAVLEGRLLAQAAAVSLDTNLITVPAP